MKTVEIVAVLAVVFLSALSLGNGAPQWRPQGRFGKRLDNRNGLLSALRSVTDGTEQLEPLFMEETDGGDGIDLYNLPLTAQMSGTPRVCVETQFPGVFRCHRRKRSTNSGMEDDE